MSLVINQFEVIAIGIAIGVLVGFIYFTTVYKNSIESIMESLTEEETDPHYTDESYIYKLNSDGIAVYKLADDDLDESSKSAKEYVISKGYTQQDLEKEK